MEFEQQTEQPEVFLLNHSMTEALRKFVACPYHGGSSKISSNDRCLTIGIAGCTNSGKTTLAKSIANRLNVEGSRAVVISQDDFYEEMHKIGTIQSTIEPSVTYHNFDAIEAVNSEQFAVRIVDEIAVNDFVLVEGNLLLEFSNIRPLLGRTVFVTLTKKICDVRRASRSYDPPDLSKYSDEVVWPAYRRSLSHACALARDSFPVVFVDGNGRNFNDVVAVQKLLNSLSKNLLLIQKSSLDLCKAVTFASTSSDGGVSAFIGTIRDSFGDKKVLRLEFEAHDEMAHKELNKLCDQIRERYPEINRIVMLHRIGPVQAAEASVIIVTSSPHRQDAIRGTELAINLLKSKVPIWKKEIYADQTSEWKKNA